MISFILLITAHATNGDWSNERYFLSWIGRTFYCEDRMIDLGIPNILIPLDLSVFLELIDDMAVLDLRGLLDGMWENHTAIVGRS